MVDEDAMKVAVLHCGQIIKVKRLNRKTFIKRVLEWKPKETGVLTFDG